MRATFPPRLSNVLLIYTCWAQGCIGIRCILMASITQRELLLPFKIHLKRLAGATVQAARTQWCCKKDRFAAVAQLGTAGNLRTASSSEQNSFNQRIVTKKGESSTPSEIDKWLWVCFAPAEKAGCTWMMPGHLNSVGVSANSGWPAHCGLISQTGLKLWRTDTRSWALRWA